MSLQNYCRKPLNKVAPETNITEACHLMEQNNIGCLVAEKDCKLCGIVTDRDIALRVAGAKRDPDKTTVKDIMTPDPIRIPSAPGSIAFRAEIRDRSTIWSSSLAWRRCSTIQSVPPARSTGRTGATANSASSAAISID